MNWRSVELSGQPKEECWCAVSVRQDNGQNGCDVGFYEPTGRLWRIDGKWIAEERVYAYCVLLDPSDWQPFDDGHGIELDVLRAITRGTRFDEIQKALHGRFLEQETVYTTLKRLEREGLIRGTWRPVVRGTQVEFELTEAGMERIGYSHNKTFLVADLEEMQNG